MGHCSAVEATVIEDQHADETEVLSEDHERFKELLVKMQTWKLGDECDLGAVEKEFYELRQKLFGY